MIGNKSLGKSKIDFWFLEFDNLDYFINHPLQIPMNSGKFITNISKKWIAKLLASSSAYKDFGSCHSLLINRNQKRLYNSAWIIKRGKDTGKIPATGQVNTGSHIFLEQRLTSNNHHGNQCQSRKTRIETDKLLETQCGQVWELKIPERPSREARWGTQHCEIYLQGLRQVLTV